MTTGSGGIGTVAPLPTARVGVDDPGRVRETSQLLKSDRAEGGAEA